MHPRGHYERTGTPPALLGIDRLTKEASEHERNAADEGLYHRPHYRRLAKETHEESAAVRALLALVQAPAPSLAADSVRETLEKVTEKERSPMEEPTKAEVANG